ncbi:hypothetical protein ACG7TL_004263 [Trametes sanguinea]
MHRDSHVRMGSSSSANGGLASTSGTVPGTSTLRPIRARLSSLGQARGHTQLRSPSTTDPGHSPLAGKKISSSSTLTLQGPKRLRSPRRPLSPASSRAGTSPENEPDDLSEESDGDEEARKEEAERQESLAQKLQKLQKLMTTDALGLAAPSIGRKCIWRIAVLFGCPAQPVALQKSRQPEPLKRERGLPTGVDPVYPFTSSEPLRFPPSISCPHPTSCTQPAPEPGRKWSHTPPPSHTFPVSVSFNLPVVITIPFDDVPVQYPVATKGIVPDACPSSSHHPGEEL